MTTFLRRNKLNVALLIISVGVFILLSVKKIINFDNYVGFSIISTNAIFAGFLYTGLGIIVSIVDKESIKRLDNNGYFDGYVNGIKIGLFLHLLSIVIAFIIMLFVLNENIIQILETVSFSSMLIGVIFFIKSVLNIFKLIKILRDENK